SLADVAYTLQVGRRGFPFRRVLVCRDVATAVNHLSNPERAPVSTAVADAADRSCVLLFSGQGSQYPGMARGLYESESSFRSTIDACCEALRPRLGRDLRELLYPEDGSATANLLTE